jgi:hypothetical protein
MNVRPSNEPDEMDEQRGCFVQSIETPVGENSALPNINPVHDIGRFEEVMAELDEDKDE